MSTPESEVLRSVMTYLRWKGVYCWRNQTGAHTAEYNGKQRLIRFGAVGSPDVIGVYRVQTKQGALGIMIGVECKAKGGKLSERQRMFLDELRGMGAIALVVYPDDYDTVIDTALAQLDAWEGV